MGFRAFGRSRPETTQVPRRGTRGAIGEIPAGRSSPPEPPDEAFVGVVLRVPNTGFVFDQGVYAYLPKLPPDLRLRDMVRLFGDWYAVRVWLD